MKGDNPTKSPFHLSNDINFKVNKKQLILNKMKKIEDLEVINSQSNILSSYAQEMKIGLKENLNINDLREWKANQNNISTVYKLVKLSIDYKEIKHQVLKILFNFLFDNYICKSLKPYYWKKLKII